MDNYTFPFKTYEKVQKEGIKQPYSTFVNVVTCVIILYFLVNTKKLSNFMLLFSIFLFELSHVFAHAFHIKGYTHTYLTHIISYFVNLSLFYVLYDYTKIIPSYGFLLVILIVMCFDIYSLLNLQLIYYMATQTLIFIFLIMYYVALLPSSIIENLYYIILTVFVILGFIVNEKINGEKMMAFNSDFPWHIFVEIPGLLLFYLISKCFYRL